MEEQLTKQVTKRQKRVGRGYGSGKGGHTVGRGQKGQKTRGKINILFEGVKVKKSFIKRLPLQRGRGKFRPGKKPLVVKLSYLDLLADGSHVNIETLSKAGIVKADDAKIFGVKILGDGEVNKKLVIETAISNSAAKKIEAAGGKVDSVTEKPKS
jgi:large subunit ribosomal protein L15